MTRLLLAALVSFLVVAPACSQNVAFPDYFPQYITSLPAGATPLAGTEALIILQGGLVKRVPSNTIASPGGADTQVQYNNNGVFGGITGATSNGTTLTIGGTINITGAFQALGNNMAFPSSPATLTALDLAHQVITGGANVTTLGLATGNITIDCGNRPEQSITNGGPFTITAPAVDGSCLLLVTNNGAAGAIGFAGFSVGGATGDPLDLVAGNKFTIFVWRIGGISGYRVAAHQ